MTNLVTVTTDEEFLGQLAEAGERPVLVDFYADWCGPCKAMAPALQAYAQEHPELLVIKADVDNLPETAMAHGIRSIPTIEMVREGKTIGKRVGALSASQLAAFVDTSLAA